MDNYGVIIRHLRQLGGLSVQQAAQQIGRSRGWLRFYSLDGGSVSKIQDILYI